MVRLQTIRLAAGFLALMVTTGYQHHRHQQHQDSCSCSCATPAQPAVVTPPPTKPEALNTVPVAPAVRTTTIGNPI